MRMNIQNCRRWIVINNVKVPYGKLMEAIKQTVFAVSKSESRPDLTGVKMEFEKNKLICTATDSHRLALREVHIESGNRKIIHCSKYKLIRIDTSKGARFFKR